MSSPVFYPTTVIPAGVLRAPGLKLAESVRVYARSLGGMLKEALVLSSRGGRTWRLASDEGAYLAGLDTAPCPLAFLTTGMVAATMRELQALAVRDDVPLGRVRLIQDNYYTMRGSALRGTMTGGARDVQLVAQCDGSASRDQITTLLHAAVAASPVNGLLRESLAGRFALLHNTQALSTLLPEIDGAPIPAADDAVFAGAHPVAADWSGLITRGGMTPKATHSVTLAGGSLAAEQDRILHVRGICTMRPDGMAQIEQSLYNPHGSQFSFVCDIDPQAHDLARAPDALTCAAAGIAFCFMTQVGRYAGITQRELRDCRIVQDVHFSGGDATSRMPGTALPVETHVHLHSGGTDDEARQILAMAEQTCFLHALCKAVIRTRISVRDWGADPPPSGAGM